MYWIIMLPDGPTAFRANTADELAPTLKQLQRAQPNAQIMWFERNRLWRSPGHAREVLEQERAAARSRSGGWRPGGDHKDPRAAYQLTREQKRRRFMGKWQEQNAEKAGRGGRSPDRPAGWTPKPGGEGRPPTHDRRPGFKPGDRSGRPPGNRRPAGGSGGWTPKPGGEGRPPTHDRRPGFKPGDRSGRPPGNRRPAGGSGSWTPKPPGVRRSTDRPAGWTPKPGGEGRPPTHDGGPGFKPGDRSGRPPGNRRPAGG
ncbi:MAG: hypothetical protein KJ066_10490, partial [Acidobacteria bacterium]|nr:hypothetical protein [Acidobacteriota bacterium]